jgi:CheY-like chemotaxis protein
MELWCRRCCAGPVKECPRAPPGSEDCCIARVPASVLRQSGKSEQLIVERDEFIATSHESMILDAGYSVGASWPDCASAGKWLSAHNPDAAIIDVNLQDRSCVELAKKLFVREIPFLAVSGYPADTPGVNRIFRSVLGWKSPSPQPGCSWHCAAFFKAESDPEPLKSLHWAQADLAQRGC